MKRLIRRIILSTVTALLLTSTAGLAGELVLTSKTDQPIKGQLTFTSSPLVTMRELPFTLTVASSSGNQADIHTAVCDLSMPAMAMPENRPGLDCSGSVCTGKAVFTMAGVWQATFGLIMKDGTHASIVFDIAKVQMK